jgi:GDP-L-fucose synthase
MVGSALVRALSGRGFEKLLTADRDQLDLRDGDDVAAFFRAQKPEVVVLAAARVGGVHANNTYPADFIRDNLMIQNAVIHQSHLSGVRLLVILGSSCIYPREASQPIREEYLLTGPLEPTNEPYAIAKIAGLRMAHAYHRQFGLRVLCPMPCNLYGPNDNYHPENSHVIAALIRRFCDAADHGETSATVWGTGQPRREFLHADDCAQAILLLMEKWDSPEIINVGSGSDLTIRELASMIAEKTGFRGNVVWDRSRPDGTPRKLLDVSRIQALGFEPQVTLERGLERAIAEYRERRDSGRL